VIEQEASITAAQPAAKIFLKVVILVMIKN
jgi:hypothetical protein